MGERGKTDHGRNLTKDRKAVRTLKENKMGADQNKDNNRLWVGSVSQPYKVITFTCGHNHLCSSSVNQRRSSTET